MTPRLGYRTVRIDALDVEQRERMLALMQRCYEGVEPERFAADLDAKQYVILLSDRDTGTLAGFSTINLRQVPFRGRTAEVLFSGDTVIHPDYWGQKMLDTAFARFLLWRKVRRPWQPFFWLLLSAGYKTYLIILNYFEGAFPRHGRHPDSEEAAFVRGLCEAWWPGQYDAERGIVRLGGHYKVRTGIAPITREELAHPDIAFFAQANPGHVDGDELVCLAQVRLGELGRAFLRIATRRWRKRRKVLPAPGGEGARA